jgi:sphingomyelin phosphodiesterase
VDTPSVKILHITDIHPDLHYTVGSDANCDDYMCCRADNPAPGSPEDEAGPYGEYKCDMPEQSMHELVENAANRYVSKV